MMESRTLTEDELLEKRSGRVAVIVKVKHHPLRNL